MRTHGGGSDWAGRLLGASERELGEYVDRLQAEGASAKHESSGDGAPMRPADWRAAAALFAAGEVRPPSCLCAAAGRALRCPRAAACLPRSCRIRGQAT
jgi:hypothetical protein